MVSDIIALIPARSGSKSLVDKNIKLLNGHPLLAYSVRVACLTKAIGRVIVSTDSEEYASIAKKYGAEAPFLRPKEISQDQSTDLDVMEHALDWLEKHEGSVPRLIVHLRPTAPLREPQAIEEAIQVIEADNTATALRSIQEMPESAYKWFEVDGEYLACLCTHSRDIEASNLGRQHYPKTYEPNGSIDILKTDFILRNKKIHGDRVRAFHSRRVVDIDDEEGFDMAAFQFMKNKDLYNEYFNSYEPMSP
jgi:N-acylneuraminate cytidylyltransferase